MTVTSTDWNATPPTCGVYRPHDAHRWQFTIRDSGGSSLIQTECTGLAAPHRLQPTLPANPQKDEQP